MTGGRLSNTRIPHGPFDRPLQHILTQVMASSLTASGVQSPLVGGKQIQPTGSLGDIGVLSFQRKRQVDCTKASRDIDLMDDLHLFNPAPERPHEGIGENRYPILAAFPVADHDLPPVDVDIMHPQPKTFEQPQSGAIEQTPHQPLRPGEKLEQPVDLGMCENHRQPTGLLGPGDIVKPGHIALEHIPIEKKQRAERLILRGSGDIAVDRKMGQKLLDFGFPHLDGMPLAVEQDKAPNPVDIGLFSANAVVFRSNGCPNPVEQARFLFHGCSPFLYSI